VAFYMRRLPVLALAAFALVGGAAGELPVGKCVQDTACTTGYGDGSGAGEVLDPDCCATEALMGCDNLPNLTVVRGLRGCGLNPSSRLAVTYEGEAKYFTCCCPTGYDCSADAAYAPTEVEINEYGCAPSQNRRRVADRDPSGCAGINLASCEDTPHLEVTLRWSRESCGKRSPSAATPSTATAAALQATIAPTICPRARTRRADPSRATSSSSARQSAAVSRGASASCSRSPS